MEGQVVESSNQRCGRPRRGSLYEKLLALGKSGELANIHTRAELAMAVGYDKSRLNSGCQWVLRRVKCGHIVENSLDKDRATGRPRYSYKLGSELPTRRTVATLPRVIVKAGDFTISMEQMSGAEIASLIKELIRKEEDGR